eukprot:NODE_618_length_2528_cov_33.022869_g527_i0.p1 GENE.NODE_618_length_2528_cov_33.022869_g527_i0~~NODE_618_length_2528_cov_33.022869_g527_i0.p1  ORF type:complete len:745 (-),score=176.39 NODE_618_length_2528_cov_33.022869_g527_i0:214-2448(-)
MSTNVANQPWTYLVDKSRENVTHLNNILTKDSSEHHTQIKDIHEEIDHLLTTLAQMQVFGFSGGMDRSSLYTKCKLSVQPSELVEIDRPPQLEQLRNLISTLSGTSTYQWQQAECLVMLSNSLEILKKLEEQLRSTNVDCSELDLLPLYDLLSSFDSLVTQAKRAPALLGEKEAQLRGLMDVWKKTPKQLSHYSPNRRGQDKQIIEEEDRLLQSRLFRTVSIDPNTRRSSLELIEPWEFVGHRSKPVKWRREWFGEKRSEVERLLSNVMEKESTDELDALLSLSPIMEDSISIVRELLYLCQQEEACLDLSTTKLNHSALIDNCKKASQAKEMLKSRCYSDISALNEELQKAQVHEQKRRKTFSEFIESTDRELESNSIEQKKLMASIIELEQSLQNLGTKRSDLIEKRLEANTEFIKQSGYFEKIRDVIEDHEKKLRSTISDCNSWNDYPIQVSNVADNALKLTVHAQRQHEALIKSAQRQYIARWQALFSELASLWVEQGHTLVLHQVDYVSKVDSISDAARSQLDFYQETGDPNEWGNHTALLVIKELRENAIHTLAHIRESFRNSVHPYIPPNLSNEWEIKLKSFEELMGAKLDNISQSWRSLKNVPPLTAVAKHEDYLPIPAPPVQLNNSPKSPPKWLLKSIPSLNRVGADELSKSLSINMFEDQQQASFLKGISNIPTTFQDSVNVKLPRIESHYANVDNYSKPAPAITTASRGSLKFRKLYAELDNSAVMSPADRSF